jgi:hypothetical protein
MVVRLCSCGSATTDMPHPSYKRRYTPGGLFTHYVRLEGEMADIALCGLGSNKPVKWLGVGSHVEYDELRERRLCRRCVQIGEMIEHKYSIIWSEHGV